MSSPPMLARFGGYCPLCGRYIAKNRSKVVALSAPVAPQTSWGESAKDGSERHHTNYARGADGRHPDDWREVSTHARTWVHAACAPGATGRRASTGPPAGSCQQCGKSGDYGRVGICPPCRRPEETEETEETE